MRFLKTVMISVGVYSCAITASFCEEPAVWLTAGSNCFTVEYESSVDLDTVAHRLNERGLFSGGFFGSEHAAAATPTEEIGRRLDRLLKRAEEILNMYPPELKITVKIFKDDSFLAEAYFRMFGTRQDYKAFYVYQYSTIYTSEYSISDSVIIHEMAHAIVDNYFSANPPPKVAEILATYVDVHLEV